jgi:ATP-dependent helicase/nuclease subunit B
VAFLAGDWAGDGPLDLAGTLVIVPTRQSGRRLREALAAQAALRGQAVFPPRVLTPEHLLVPARPAASPLESLLAWAELLREVDLGGCREVFPVDPPARDFAWALRLAQEFAGLQRELAEGGLRLADVADRAGDFPETARWRQLGALEQLHAARLARAGKVDGQAARLAAAADPGPLAGVTRLVLLATPDPLPLALAALEVHARALPVEVVVHAPAAEAEHFDAWGRPRPETWEHRVLALPDLAAVRLCADPAAQARRIADQAAGLADPAGRLAVGLADPEVRPALEAALRRAGVPVFNPEGRLRRHEGFYQLLAALAALVRAPDFAAVAALARCPDVLAHLAERCGAGFSAARWLAGLDELNSRHLPADLAAARRHAAQLRDHPQLGAALAALAELQALLSRGGFATSVAAALARIHAHRRSDLTDPEQAGWVEAAGEWMDLVRLCGEAEVRHPSLARTDWWDLALRIYGDGRKAEDKPAEAIELPGWLELPWEDAPHLVVAGCNDGRVPEAVAGDAYLPESLRVRLGLKSNAARFARDAYLLQALAASRASAGRLELCFGKYSAAGEPLRPSRLLLRCPDHELPARVRRLFRDPELAAPARAWHRAWRLTPPLRPAPERLSVTALRSWLKCPLRFYLRHVLGMQAVDPAKGELDALDFGTLCHGALEAAGREPALAESTDEAQLRDFLRGEFDRRLQARHGTELTLPLLVQAESAHQRLAKAAGVLARERAAGWRVAAVERKFELPLGGLVLAGKIDRIERHEGTGAVRVLDFKTSDTAATPAEAHLRRPPAGWEPREWARVTVDGRDLMWTDLQLPLYRHVLAAEYGGDVACGYLNLPKAVGETGLLLWEGYTPELQAAAGRCAEGVVAAVRAGEFWPPRELTGREAELDDFAALFHGGAAASLAWEEAGA